MVNPGLTIKLFDFQEQAVLKLLDLTAKPTSKQTVVMKAPTGSGKTIILIDYVDEYLTNVNNNTAFIWLCPGKGNLEEQSRDKMQKIAPHRTTQNLFDSLLNGFTPGSTTFINWELVTKKGNTAIRDSERKNLFERIADAHRNGIEFIVIIDEEHSNNTAKAKVIIDAFAAKNIIRVSATAIENKRYEFFEIDEIDVIDAGLITKALYVNEGISDNLEITDDYDYLLDLADAKRKDIAKRYQEIGKNIRPLVLIQFPNGQPETILAVEQKLESMGYTYNNGMVREVTSDMAVQMSLTLHPKKSQFHIPEQDFFKYDPGVKSEVEYLSNAYHEYTSGYATSLVRSTSEILFEQYCENQSDIEWVYKNGDTGQQYFSIVYIDALQHQWLFYADYIVMKKDGTVWVIETKGGESKGQDKNIDKQIENKFNAFKKYAEEKGLHWGFVRDKDNQLYINNTVFSKDMSDEHWIPLKQEF